MVHSSSPPSRGLDRSSRPPADDTAPSSKPPSRRSGPSSKPPSARFKGAILRPLKPWMEGTFGIPAVEAAFASMPKELAGDLSATAPNFGALPATWYDARIYRHLFDELLRGRPDDDATLD